MNYEAWRITYQSSEQAARAAFDMAVEARAELDALKGQDQVVVKIGNCGAAFDGPCVKRAYTYEHQPGNVVALKLGRAAAQASFERGGDFIDFGLSLLRALAEEGFGVFDAGAEFSASVPPVPSVPDGWQMVPKRITPHMGHAVEACLDDDGSIQAMWDAAIAAAPQPERSADESVRQSWARFCHELHRSPDAPYPGMSEAFERHFSQSFIDRDWRRESQVWAAAWKSATSAERDRICAAIKAEDDYCCDAAGYMLDSDDCIAVARGEWRRPEFSAAPKQEGE